MSSPESPVRQRLSAEQRREQLADAAIAVVAEGGYPSATADAIAQRAGTSKGLLWHYFADRDDLLEFTARRALAVLRERVAADIDLTQPVPAVIGNAVRRAVALRSTHGTELTGIREIVSHLRNPDGTMRLGLEDYEETYAGQEALFHRGQMEGDLNPDISPRVMAVVYQGAIDAILSYLDTHPDIDADHYADSAARMLLHGLCSPDPTPPLP